MIAFSPKNTFLEKRNMYILRGLCMISIILQSYTHYYRFKFR